MAKEREKIKDKVNEKIKATKVNILAEKVDRSLEIEPEQIAEESSKITNISPIEMSKKAADHIPPDPTHQISE